MDAQQTPQLEKAPRWPAAANLAEASSLPKGWWLTLLFCNLVVLAFSILAFFGDIYSLVGADGGSAHTSLLG